MEKVITFNKRRVFNKALGPGNKSKINKRRATFIPDYRVIGFKIVDYFMIYNC